MYHYTEVDFNSKSIATSRIATDEQTVAQAELNAYISQQAQEIAPEPEVQFIDLDNFYNYKACDSLLSKNIEKLRYSLVNKR